MKRWPQKWTLGTIPKGVTIRYRTLSPSHLSPSAHTVVECQFWHVPLPVCLGHVYLGTPFCIFPEKPLDRNFPSTTSTGVTLLPGSKASGKICSEIWGQFWSFLPISFILILIYHKINVSNLTLEEVWRGRGKQNNILDIKENTWSTKYTCAASSAAAANSDSITL